MARSKKSKTARVAKQPRGPVELVKWKGRPDEHDYPAAANYLSLLVADPQLRAHLVAELQGAPLVSYEAKDLLRASQLPQLTKANAHVALDLKKIRKRIPLSPVLLVRGDLVGGFPLQIADGYHRVCASHIVDENTAIPCRLIDLPVVAPAGRAPVRPAVRVPAPTAAPAVVPAVEVAEVEVAAGAHPPARAATSRKTTAGTTAARKTAVRKTAARKATGGSAAAAKAPVRKVSPSKAAALPPADVAPASSSPATDASTG